MRVYIYVFDDFDVFILGNFHVNQLNYMRVYIYVFDDIDVFILGDFHVILFWVFSPT